MTVYFFSRVNKASRVAFRSYCTLQNLRTVRTISLIYFILNFIIRILATYSSLPFNNINHVDELAKANMISTLVSPLFYFGAVILLKYLKNSRIVTLMSYALVILFCLFIITNGMRITFFAMHNPRNTLVMYLAALTLAGVFFTIEYFETLIIVAVTSTIFMLVVPSYQPDFSEQMLNDIVSFVLLILYFCISRFLFSYRADNYLKLRAIEEKNMEIETASRLKNEILGIVAHDLRNPLAAIRALAIMMEDDKTMNADNQENLQMIKTSCDKATSIINDLIETAHNDKDNVFDIEEVELNQYLLKIVDEWAKNKTDPTNILYYGTDKPIYTHINMEKMQRVMDNLISNAIKFSGESECVEVRLRNTDGQIYIDVKDFGMGIPDSILPYIFDRFSRASRRGIRGEESVGLGLSIVKQIVEKHGGDISVTTAEKQGTTFTIHMTPVRSNTKARQ